MKNFVFREHQVLRRWASCIQDDATLTSGVSGIIIDSKDVEFFESETPLEDPREFAYSSPSFGPSTGMEHLWLEKTLMTVLEGALIIMDNGTCFLFQGGEWLESQRGQEYQRMNEPFAEYKS